MAGDTVLYTSVLIGTVKEEGGVQGEGGQGEGGVQG